MEEKRGSVRRRIRTLDNSLPFECVCKLTFAIVAHKHSTRWFEIPGIINVLPKFGRGEITRFSRSIIRKLFSSAQILFNFCPNYVARISAAISELSRRIFRAPITRRAKWFTAPVRDTLLTGSCKHVHRRMADKLSGPPSSEASSASALIPLSTVTHKNHANEF